MPKRVGYLYGKLIDKDFIREAIDRSARHKTNRYDVQRVLADKEKYVGKLYCMMRDRTYTPAEPKRRTVYDPSSQKMRDIQYVPYYPDGIIQWMLVSAMMPVLMRGMYAYSCASIPGRGTIKVLRKAKAAIQRDKRNTKYAAELDIRHFYPSVRMDELVKVLEHKIKDKEFVTLVMVSCTSFPGGMPEVRTKGLTAMDVAGDQVGLAIGYYINQWLANFFLESTDHFVKSLEGVKYMTRYMDNINIMGPSKRKLHKAIRNIRDFLKSKALELKGNWQVFHIDKRPLSTVGFRIGRTRIRMRKRNFLLLMRQSRRIQKRLAQGLPMLFAQASGMISRAGALKHCNGFSARQKYIDPIGISKLKEAVRNESIRRQRTGERFFYGAAAQTA